MLATQGPGLLQQWCRAEVHSPGIYLEGKGTTSEISTEGEDCRQQSLLRRILWNKWPKSKRRSSSMSTARLMFFRDWISHVLVAGELKNVADLLVRTVHSARSGQTRTVAVFGISQGRWSDRHWR